MKGIRLGQFEKHFLNFLFPSFSARQIQISSLNSEINHSSEYGYGHEVVSPLKAALVIWHLKQLTRRMSAYRIIDIGSGTGFLLKILRIANFKNLVGIEVDPCLFYISQKNLKSDIERGYCLLFRQDAAERFVVNSTDIGILFNPFGEEKLNQMLISNKFPVLYYINDRHSRSLELQKNYELIKNFPIFRVSIYHLKKSTSLGE